MKKVTLASVLAVVFLFTLPLEASAQTLAEGTWEGSITQPGDSVQNVSFTVAYTDGDLAITMDEGAPVPFHDEHFADGDLHVSWMSGDVVIRCTLEPQDDGGFRGDCVTPDGGVVGELEMTPPAG